MKRTALVRRTPMKPGKPLRPGGRLKPVGRRGRRLAAGDARARQQARANAKGICLRCNLPGSDHHHWVRRGIESVRHHPWNQCFLCRPCHDYFRDNPEEERQFIRNCFTPEQAEWIFHQRKGWRDDRVQS